MNVAVSDAIREELLMDFRIGPDRVVTIPAARDAGRLEPTMGRAEIRRALGIPEGAPVLVSIGALSREKDPMAQLDLLEKVASLRPGTMLIMAGDGPLRRRLEEEIGRRRLDGRVKLLGARADVGNLLAAADILVMTSTTEGLGAAVVEAGFAAVPAAAYAVGAI